MEGNGRPVFQPSVDALPSVRGPASVTATAAYMAQNSPRQQPRKGAISGLFVLRDNLYSASRLALDGGPQGPPRRFFRSRSSTRSVLRPVATAAGSICTRPRKKAARAFCIARTALKGLDFLPLVCYTLGRLQRLAQCDALRLEAPARACNRTT